jgi:phosphopantetheinyl transferase
LEDFENLSTLFTCRTFVLNNTELEYSYGFEVENQNNIVLKLDIFQGRKFESNDTISKIYSKSTGFEKICEEIEENIFIIKSDFINSKWTWNMVENTYLDNFDRTRSQSIKHIKSQQSFILGRLAARESVKNHLNKKYTTKALFPTQIFISYDADNSPIANCLDVIDKEFHLSISHKDKYGIAFFGGDHKVGVDMEKILHESFDFSGKLVFSKSELALIERFNQSNKSTIKTIIWTAKESFFKQFENKREIKFTALVVQKIEEEASSKYEQKWIGKINGKSFTSIQWDKEYIITWII